MVNVIYQRFFRAAGKAVKVTVGEVKTFQNHACRFFQKWKTGLDCATPENGKIFHSIILLKATDPRLKSSVYCLGSICLLRRYAAINRTDFSTLRRVKMTLAFNTHVRVYYIDLPLANRIDWTLWKTYTASNAVFGYL